MTTQKLADRMQTGLSRLAEPTQLDGEHIDLVPDKFGLHLTEISMALGVNSAALYSKKSNTEPLNSTLAILLRLYAAFPEFLPRITPPTPQALWDKINEIDPRFKGLNLGPMLGMETNSSYRFMEIASFNKSAQTTRALAALIDNIITANPADLALVKEAVEIEAQACNITPVQSVWKSGGWKAKKAKLAETGQLRVKATSSTKIKKEAPISPTAKAPIRRSRTTA